MMAAGPVRPLVLAVYPTSRGLGWAAFESPLAPYDWGSVEPRADKNVRCLQALEGLFDRFAPGVLVLESFERPVAKRSKRIADLCRGMIAFANDRDAEVAIYRRTDVQECFGHLGAKTRHAVAAAVARHLPSLAQFLPPVRTAWASEYRAEAIFNAAALALTHYATCSNDFLGDLKREALEG